MINIIKLTKTDGLSMLVDFDKIISVDDKGKYRVVHISMSSTHGNWTQSIEVKDSVSNITRASKEMTELYTKCSKILIESDNGCDIPVKDFKELITSIKDFLS